MVTLTLRRYYIDDFLNDRKTLMTGRVLDIGGKKDNKRGFFRPPLEVVDSWEYLNIDGKTAPDYACSVYKMPFSANAFDTIIFCEILEHLKEPQEALSEISRITKPGGRLIMTMPFLFAVHADPGDYQRWTEEKIRNELSDAGFGDIDIKPMGGILAVIYDLIHFAIKSTFNLNKFLFRVVYKLYFLPGPLLKFVDKKLVKNNPVITTGYSVVAVKL